MQNDQWLFCIFTSMLTLGMAMQKVCTKCGQTKALADFNRRKNGYQSHCRECARAYIRQHYQANRAYYREKNKRKLQRIFTLVRSAKDKPCADCGQSYPYYVMDFDHREGEIKTTEVTRLISTHSIRRVQEEIAKCDVVCSNCHRVRTFKRRSKHKPL